MCCMAHSPSFDVIQISPKKQPFPVRLQTHTENNLLQKDVGQSVFEFSIFDILLPRKSISVLTGNIFVILFKPIDELFDKIIEGYIKIQVA